MSVLHHVHFHFTWIVQVFIHQSASGQRRPSALSPCSYRHSSRMKPAVWPTSCLPICSCPQSHFLSDKHGRFMWSSSVWHHFLIFLFPASLMWHSECFFFRVRGEAGRSVQTLYSSTRTRDTCILNDFSFNSKMFKSSLLQVKAVNMQLDVLLKENFLNINQRKLSFLQQYCQWLVSATDSWVSAYCLFFIIHCSSEGNTVQKMLWLGHI